MSRNSDLSVCQFRLCVWQINSWCTNNNLIYYLNIDSKYILLPSWLFFSSLLIPAGLKQTLVRSYFLKLPHGSKNPSHFSNISSRSSHTSESKYWVFSVQTVEFWNQCENFGNIQGVTWQNYWKWVEGKWIKIYWFEIYWLKLPNAYKWRLV